MKTVYICGDSFSSTDPEYPGLHWTEKLANSLKNEFKVVNLSRPGSSNFFIRVQVDRAIENNADYVIFHGTTSTRDEISFRDKKYSSNLFDRFVHLTELDNSQKDLSCYSYHSIDHTTLFNEQQLDFLKKYYLNFVDLDIMIKKNQYLIESTLSTLVQSNIPFKFDQGGFEHPKFGNVLNTKYFLYYQKYFSKINLWDYADTKLKSPLCHVVDDRIHLDVAKYYSNEIIKDIG